MERLYKGSGRSPSFTVQPIGDDGWQVWTLFRRDESLLNLLIGVVDGRHSAPRRYGRADRRRQRRQPVQLETSFASFGLASIRLAPDAFRGPLSFSHKLEM